jgi:hypothetical protein
MDARIREVVARPTELSAPRSDPVRLDSFVLGPTGERCVSSSIRQLSEDR